MKTEKNQLVELRNYFRVLTGNAAIERDELRKKADVKQSQYEAYKHTTEMLDAALEDLSKEAA